MKLHRERGVDEGDDNCNCAQDRDDMHDARRGNVHEGRAEASQKLRGAATDLLRLLLLFSLGATSSRFQLIIINWQSREIR